MTIRCLTLFSAALWFGLVLLPQTQDARDAEIIEEDYRVTSVEGRHRAVENLLKSVADLRESGQVIKSVQTLNRVGRFQIRMFVAGEAVTTFQESLKLLQHQPDPKTQVDSLNGLASSYGKLSKCELAEPSAGQALALSKQHNYVAGEAEALLILSDCQNLRDHALALKTAQESLALWSSIDRKRGMAETYLAIGEYHMTLHNLADCAKSLEAALNIFRELNDPVQQAEVLIYFGYIDYRNADWQGALAYHTQARSMIDKAAEPFKMGQITIGLGDAFLESGMPDVALPKYHEALDYFRITKNQRAISILKWSIGKAHYFSGQHEDALKNLLTARSEAQSSSDVTLTAFCDDFLGRTYHAQNNDAAALSHFQSAFDGYSRAKNTREAARVLALMGEVYQQQAQYPRAGDNYEKALETFRFLGDRVNESATLYAIGTLELRQNNLDKAAEYLRQSIAFTEEVRRVSSSSDLTAAFSARINDRYKTYIDCLMRKHSADSTQEYDVRAFEMSESARGRSLAELLRGTQTNLAPGIDPQLAHREKLLRQSLRVKENYRVTLLGRQYKQEEFTSLESELARLTTEYKEVNDAIIARYPSYGEINRPTSWDLRRIQEQAVPDDETVLLEYSLGPDRSYVWIVTRKSITSRELPPEEAITKAAGEVYELLKITPDKETQARLSSALHKLSSQVLLPIAAELKKRRIIVVADGALNYVPFQILHGQPDNDEPLLATREIINAPSASILGQLRQETARRQAPAKTLAAFGDPVFASNYAQHKSGPLNQPIAALQGSDNEPWRHALRDIEPDGDNFEPLAMQQLFYSRIELANLHDVAGPDSFVATGFEATRENLADVDLGEYAILHIATHGILDPKRPEKSGLLLSMMDPTGKPLNGFLGLQDIYSLNAPVDLVVLSACRTGLGKDVRGEGLIGLTRGFMYAGASSVVASLWKVDDEATAELMKRFYSNMLQRGMRPADALRAAQNSIRQEPQWRAPYYWAAFTLQGEYLKTINQPAAAGVVYQKLVVGVFCLALLGAGAWWFSRRGRSRYSRVN